MYTARTLRNRGDAIYVTRRRQAPGTTFCALMHDVQAFT